MARLVVLDLDGKLMDTSYLHTEARARAFEEAGHRVPRAGIHRQVGKGSGLLIREFVDDETVAVGDAVWDIESAKGAGIRTVAVLSGGAFSARELREAGAADVQPHCAALLETEFPE